MQLYDKRFFRKIEETVTVKAIRDGLIMAIPILMMGSFSLILSSLPIRGYQIFLENFHSGILIDLFSTIHDATFGLLSVHMVCTISIAMSRIKSSKDMSMGAVYTSLICFALLSGVFIGDAEQIITDFGHAGTFTAIIVAVCATNLYFVIKDRVNLRIRFFAEGADTNFNGALMEIFPAMSVVLIFAVFNILTANFLHTNSLNLYLTELINMAFADLGRTFVSGLIFVILSSILWFFGIHGSDALIGVAEGLFEPAIQENVNSIAIGLLPTEILSKTFFDVFVLMGGCGASLSLLVAVLIFSKHKNNRSLAKLATLPMVFNINELMIFGLPVVFNTALLIPFVLTPVITLIISYTAMSVGLVPVAATAVEWTTPIILGGYLSTGSVWGSLLQIVNLVVGMFIYKPFMDMYDKEKLRHTHENMESLINVLKVSEKNNAPVILTDIKDSSGGIARMLVGDLEKAIEQKQFDIYYQPQHDNKGNCIGVEALLRWNHSIFGMIYPPLVIKLAGESNTLIDLEKSIFETSVRDAKSIGLFDKEDFKLSINVSASTIQKEKFVSFLLRFAEENQIPKGQICVEVTEQAALIIDERLYKTFESLHKSGYLLAIDDFSMGATSLKYLQQNQFDLVKLDGNLIKEIESNSNSRNIVASIVYLADSLGFSILAEYVENEEERGILEEIGCVQYQGYLYSPAIPIIELEAYLDKSKPQ